MRRISILAALSLFAMLVTSPAAFAQPAEGEPGNFDCDNFSTQALAQESLDAAPSDPYNLDADGDGIACESLLENGQEGTPPGEQVPNPEAVPCDQILTTVQGQQNYATNFQVQKYGEERVQECIDQLGAQQPGADEMQYDEPEGMAPEEPPATGGGTGGMTNLPDTGGLPLGGVAAGLGVALVAGGLLLRNRLS